jgi:hypothetical protein
LKRKTALTWYSEGDVAGQQMLATTANRISHANLARPERTETD